MSRLKHQRRHNRAIEPDLCHNAKPLARYSDILNHVFDNFTVVSFVFDLSVTTTLNLKREAARINVKTFLPMSSHINLSVAKPRHQACGLAALNFNLRKTLF